MINSYGADVQMVSDYRPWSNKCAPDIFRKNALLLKVCLQVVQSQKFYLLTLITQKNAINQEANRVPTKCHCKVPHSYQVASPLPSTRSLKKIRTY